MAKQIYQRLHECDECGSRRFVTFLELTRAAKPKCHYCGCSRLELVCEEAKADRARLQSDRLDRLALIRKRER
ncbi:MAG: hypothetical protein FJ276_19295 [Planctomycetes bacterium]|nr:hypothetical protein [Planctomycetota bacterium]